MEILDEMDQTHKKEMQLYNSIFSLLSFEKIGYTGNHSDRLLGKTSPSSQYFQCVLFGTNVICVLMKPVFLM